MKWKRGRAVKGKEGMFIYSLTQPSLPIPTAYKNCMLTSSDKSSLQHVLSLEDIFKSMAISDTHSYQYKMNCATHLTNQSIIVVNK